MKRFYKEAIASPVQGGFGISLDGRPVRTPARAPLVLPTEALAVLVADEWNRQGDELDPRSMPLTGLANAAIDRVAPDKEAFARGLSVYGESDLLCYRADAPSSLAERQARYWDPIIAWAQRRFDINFEIVCGIMHRAQPQHTLEQLAHAVASRDPYELAALSPLVTLSGSLLIALALAEEVIDLEAAWDAATLDEHWQVEQWGEDTEAMARLAARRAEFDAAYRFLKLL